MIRRINEWQKDHRSEILHAEYAALWILGGFWTAGLIFGWGGFADWHRLEGWIAGGLFGAAVFIFPIAFHLLYGHRWLMRKEAEREKERIANFRG